MFYVITHIFVLFEEISTMEVKSGWPMAMKYGLMLALAYVSLHLAGHLIAPPIDPENTSPILYIFKVISVGLSGYIMYLGAKLRRDEDLGGIASFGAAFGFIVMLSLPASFITSLYDYIYTSFINPELTQKIMNQQLDKMAEGKSEDEIVMAKKIMGFFKNPAIVIVFGTFINLIIYMIYALVVSVFVKKEPKIFE